MEETPIAQLVQKAPQALLADKATGINAVVPGGKRSTVQANPDPDGGSAGLPGYLQGENGWNARLYAGKAAHQWGLYVSDPPARSVWLQLKQSPVVSQPVFHQAEIPGDFTVSNVGGYLQHGFGFLPGSLHHRRTVRAEGGGQDHGQRGALIIHLYIPDEAQLDNIQVDLRIEDLAKLTAQRFHQFRVAVIGFPVRFIDIFILAHGNLRWFS
jgi:hypothetical protein